ncbi:MAG TPA: hypothetical protein PLM07_02695 [Candidatus Rifleibacterium sp.]|nr:hypothetical protein [Candidatus Rifleibacterium sp.]HPT44792.1 hypothetical protein [Candidatus Rifleibacterium sp.]
MNSNITRSRRGMLIVIVCGVLIFSMIIFISLVNRVKHEAAVTNRVSVNERLFQIASAIGRLSVRKLQKDFETREQDFGLKIIQSAFSNKTGAQESVDYTKVIKNLDVTKEVFTRFKSEWGDRGEIDFTVTYIADLGKAYPFKAPIAGLANSPYERKGHIEFTVTVNHMGISKICRIRKEFMLTRLLAPPFYRFTIFSHRGATIDKALANQTFIKDDGKLNGSTRPMVCLNRLVRKKKDGQEGFDFRFNRADNIVKTGSPSFIKNGWIYLGGRGQQKDSKGDEGNLILNVLTGSHDDMLENSFGEYFHFYFNSSSAGWLILKDWSAWMNQQIPKNKISEDASRVMLAFVDYGYYKGLWEIPFRNNYLFKKAIEMYKIRINEDINRGNSMHLFGTPALCTPTLVFGKIKRRFARTFAFYFSESARVYPLRAFTSDDAVKEFISEEVYEWYKDISGTNADEEFIQSYSSAFTDKIKATEYQLGLSDRVPPLCGLDPEIRDWEPYISALHNICDPGGPDRPWADVVPKNGYIDAGPEAICKDDYEFKNDAEIHYNGKLRNIIPDEKYLKDRVSFMLPGIKDKETMLSKIDFFQNHFMIEEKGKKLLYLNQIICFDGDLVIDEPLEVAKGGIIICTGKIDVQAPIINPYLSGAPDNADAFGYLTLIASRGITLSNGNPGAGPLPQMHGFFISMGPGGDGKITINKPMHIIGGISSDNIEDLVKQGCIVEWGFEPAEIAGGKDFSTSDYYGLAMGPRDIEIITED